MPGTKRPAAPDSGPADDDAPAPKGDGDAPAPDGGDSPKPAGDEPAKPEKADLSDAPADGGTPAPEETAGTSKLTDTGAAPAAAPAAEEGTLDVQLFTSGNKPAAGFEVELTLPDGTKTAGTTNGDGHFVAQHLPKIGNCTLQLADIDVGAPAATTPPPPAGR